jgi:serine kinase of HPr protein (carbohydrate metabolism regulator)
MSVPPGSARHQATCISVEGRGVLIEGPPGSGKSSLALALIDRGAVLVGDDGVSLEQHGTRLIASPVPATRGLLEVRNLGIIGVGAVMPRVTVALVLVLDAAAPRFIAEAESTTRLGSTLPLIRLWPDSPVLALRAELALRHYGLSV